MSRETTTLDLPAQAAAAASSTVPSIMTSITDNGGCGFEKIHQVLGTHATVIQQDNQKIRILEQKVENLEKMVAEMAQKFVEPVKKLVNTPDSFVMLKN
jgi:hypothetical protein